MATILRGGGVKAAGSIVERVALDDRQAPGISVHQLLERLDAATVALDRRDMTGAVFEQCAGQPAGPGADLDDRGGVERARGAGDAPRQVEIEEEMLAEPLARADSVLSDNLAQRSERRRSLVGRSLVGWFLIGLGQCGGDQATERRSLRRLAISPASRKAAMRLVGLATPLPAISKAVP